MAEFDTVIRNAVVVTAADVFTADIGIAGGIVTALGRGLGPARRDDRRGRTLRAARRRRHALPLRPADARLGHARRRFPLRHDLRAHGGTTTVVPFACQFQGQSVRAAVDDYHRRAAGKPVIDYAFHLIVSDPTEDVLREELPALIARGLHVVQDLHDLRDPEAERPADHRGARAGATRGRHGDGARGELRLHRLAHRRARARGQDRAVLPRASAPPAVEREGTHRAITMSEIVDVPILLVHVSARGAVEQIRWAQWRGIQIFAETCPQYLVLTADDLDAPGFEGAKYICSPPPRDGRARRPSGAAWQRRVPGVLLRPRTLPL